MAGKTSQAKGLVNQLPNNKKRFLKKYQSMEDIHIYIYMYIEMKKRISSILGLMIKLCKHVRLLTFERIVGDLYI